MKKLPLLLSVFVLIVASSLKAQEDRPELGINLEGYEYPYEVEFYELHTQGQQLDMAFMYEQAENSNGRTVLMFHGKNFNGAYWEQTMNALLDEGYNVLVPDQIGFGKSSKPAHYHYTFHQLARNTQNLVDSLGISTVTVLGHSMGGMLATRFSLMYPDDVEKLILENPIGLEDWKTKVPYAGLENWYQSSLSRTFEGVKSYMMSSYFDGQWEEKYNEWVYLLTAMRDSPDWERYAWNSALTYDMVFTQPVVYEFKNLEMPTVLIIGQRDRTALGTGSVPDSVAATMGNYPRLGKETAEKIPNSTLIELNDIGHLPHIEDFDLFISKLLPALKK
ncbi:alpha/beta hydrolase [Aliifodinibius sp. S!AR15-10]|uniref:alpha/beta fold hydrolase n=1 Tax=Aliifodinibius sp. S!AR15-10 TaxID=2950437 RepID=UPI002863EAC0|nr:alpha/beta hydrolase [Aliifodinibius sp. S!AR15-10]MDR8394333.1 alpha/beta hydrolase [Aliifodinibius sp. S!AR15-10]